jgi:hypothetical protein
MERLELGSIRTFRFLSPTSAFDPNRRSAQISSLRHNEPLVSLSGPASKEYAPLKTRYAPPLYATLQHRVPFYRVTSDALAELLGPLFPHELTSPNSGWSSSSVESLHLGDELRDLCRIWKRLSKILLSFQI